MNSSMRQHNDSELALYATLGSLEAFDELARRYRPALVIVAQQIVGCRAEAEDVAQEALLIAFRALPSLQSTEKFAGWLWAITRNHACRTARRMEKKKSVTAEEMDELLLLHCPELTRTPALEAERNMETEKLLQAVEKLPEEFRVLLTLHHLQGWPIARLCSFLLLPQTTVKWRLHEGRRRLRLLLGEDVVKRLQGDKRDDF